MTASVQFVFEDQQAVALPRLLDIVRHSLRSPDVEAGQIIDASLSSLRFEAPGLQLDLSLSRPGDEIVVTLSLSLPDVSDTAAEALRLAPVAFAMLRDTEAQFVIWNGTKARIPREAFLAGLAAQFGTASKGARSGTAISPRRVTRSTPSLTPRRPSRQEAPTARPRATDRYFDAHVQTFETFMKTELRRAPNKAEIAQMREDMQEKRPRLEAGSAGPNSAELRAASLVTTITALVIGSGALQIT
ncbi:hypothetical protein GGQ68_001946 [Sagittula marina]|uniref:Uncharacterized protein n=1 Tax=Sagittula marina TaxID=943940 RepID=A0A7W6DMB5_9RHOB|nr:hypothetical protein [Sagittula marina]MBB3985613.1 hypothetical protein [Sagittula marina]